MNLNILFWNNNRWFFKHNHELQYLTLEQGPVWESSSNKQMNEYITYDGINFAHIKSNIYFGTFFFLGNSM